MPAWSRNTTPHRSQAAIRKALAKALTRSRAMTSILAQRAAETRAAGEAMIREADDLLCQSWNERMWPMASRSIPRRPATRRSTAVISGLRSPREVAGTSENGPGQGAISLVIPMAMTLLDDHGSLPAIFVPTTVQTAIMSIVAVLRSSTTKLTARTILAAISVHVPIAANTNAKLLSTGNG
jgi:hypothetical protein